MFPSDLDIFSPVSRSIPLCIQYAREAPAGRLRLGALVLVMGEDQIEAPTVHVEVLAELV